MRFRKSGDLNIATSGFATDVLLTTNEAAS